MDPSKLVKQMQQQLAVLSERAATQSPHGEHPPADDAPTRCDEQGCATAEPPVSLFCNQQMSVVMPPAAMEVPERGGTHGSASGELLHQEFAAAAGRHARTSPSPSGTGARGDDRTARASAAGSSASALEAAAGRELPPGFRSTQELLFGRPQGFFRGYPVTRRERGTWRPLR